MNSAQRRLRKMFAGNLIVKDGKVLGRYHRVAGSREIALGRKAKVEREAALRERLAVQRGVVRGWI